MPSSSSPSPSFLLQGLICDNVCFPFDYSGAAATANDNDSISDVANVEHEEEQLDAQDEDMPLVLQDETSVLPTTTPVSPVEQAAFRSLVADHHKETIVMVTKAEAEEAAAEAEEEEKREAPLPRPKVRKKRIIFTPKLSVSPRKMKRNGKKGAGSKMDAGNTLKIGRVRKEEVMTQ